MTDETERGAPHRISGGAFSSFCGPSGAADAELHPVEGFRDRGVRRCSATSRRLCPSAIASMHGSLISYRVGGNEATSDGLRSGGCCASRRPCRVWKRQDEHGNRDEHRTRTNRDGDCHGDAIGYPHRHRNVGQTPGAWKDVDLARGKRDSLCIQRRCRSVGTSATGFQPEMGSD